MRYHLVTLGCPKNVADSQKLERLIRQRGHEPGTLNDSDIVIVNTCSFIDAAKEESIDTILRLGAHKRPGQTLVVAGCLPEIHGRELMREIKEIDHLFGVEAWDKIADLLVKTEPERAEIKGGPAAGPDGPARVSAYLKIADGCNARCSFCLIPRIKGRLHSAPITVLLDEAQRFLEEGAREIVLIAQDTTAYGRDLGMREGLSELLERLAMRLPRDVWLRVMYAYPGHVSTRLITTMASLPQVCKYLDIPLQHSSPEVLRRMRRPHDVLTVRRMLGRLREAMPDISLRTTFLVGFPGETEGDFRGLLDFMREVRFDHVGAFPFSPQEGTEAARLPDQVPERVKQRRYRELMVLARKFSLERNREWVGKELTVLVESRPAKDGEKQIAAGRSYRDAPEIDGLVIFEGPASPGEMLPVRITQALAYDLLGVPVRPQRSS